MKYKEPNFTNKKFVTQNMKKLILFHLQISERISQKITKGAYTESSTYVLIVEGL